MKVVSKFSWIPMIPDSESSDTFWAGNLVCKMRGGAGRRRPETKSSQFGVWRINFSVQPQGIAKTLDRSKKSTKEQVQPTKFSHDHPTNRKHLACFREGTWQSVSQESDVHSEMIGVDIAPNDHLILRNTRIVWNSLTKHFYKEVKT